MGEYARFNGDEIKIGTCEDLYYLRADQRSRIQGYGFDAGTLAAVRFRFPFPDEDTLKPGSFEDYDRSERIPGDWTLPADFEHDGSVQFSAPPGYLISLPCPESDAFEATGLRVGRNGWRGGYGVSQTASREGEWRLIVTCRSCGRKWNLPREHAESVAAAFAEEAERQDWRMGWALNEAGEWKTTGQMGWEPAHQPEAKRFHLEMAARIMAGYALEEVAS